LGYSTFLPFVLFFCFGDGNTFQIEQDVSSVDIININNNNNSPKIQPRIVGGTSVNPAENRYPYFALMWGQGVCGGVLIAPSIVLTAAHVRRKKK